jgi:hypothetical protein
MHKKTLYFSSLFAIFISFVIGEGIYLSIAKSMTKEMKEKKNYFVSLVGLSDLAISTEASYVRNRSVSSIFAIYKDDPTLREYFPSTYAISYSHIINPHTQEDK